MRARRWMELLVGCVTLLTPCAAAETHVESTTLEVGLAEAFHQRTFQYSANESQAIRDHLDEDHGNDDGIVTRAEVRQYEEDHAITYQENRADCYQDFTLVRLDDQPPTHTKLRAQELEGAEGPVTSPGTIRIRHVTTYEFEHDGRLIRHASVDLYGADLDDVESDCVTATPGRIVTGFSEGFSHWAWEFVVFPDNLKDPRNPVPIAYAVGPRPGHNLDRESLDPSRLRPLWDGQGWSSPDPGHGSLRLQDGTLKFDVVEGTIFYPAGDASYPAAVYSVLALSLLLGALLGVGWHYQALRIKALWWILGLAGFTRLEQDQVLAHKRREELLHRVRENPGVNFSDLRRASEIPNGPLVYHLRVLSQRGHLRAVRDGARVRYYPRVPGVTFPVPRTERQERLLEVVGGHPGLSQRLLAKELGWSRLAVHRQAKRLAATGELRVVQEGRLRHYYPGVAHRVEAPPIGLLAGKASTNP